MQAPFGSWQSPITTDLIVTGSVGLGGARYANNCLYWHEARPQEAGRVCVVRRDADGAIADLIPPPFNARSRVHEYGGGAWTVIDQDLCFTNFADQDLYLVTPGSDKPVRLTREPTLRFANAVYDSARNRIVCIVESHGEGESEAENYLAAVDRETGEVTALATGHDFFSSPTISPDGRSIAWMTWDHPDMPWDSTRIWRANLEDNGSLKNIETVAGGENIAAQQPTFSPAGELWLVSDESGWWNLYRLRDNRIECMLPMEAEFGLPHWVFGLTTFTFDADGSVICVYDDEEAAHLARFDTTSLKLSPIKTGFTSIGGPSVAGGRCVFIGASPTEFPAIVELELASGHADVFKRSSTVDVDQGYLSIPEAVTFTTADEDVAHGYFYAPANKDVAHKKGNGSADEKPPLIVMLHGGPTSSTGPVLALAKQFWTSRGFAVLDLNYRGSSGYGREYRNKLRGGWGIVEVDDCVYGARSLVDRGLVDGDRLAIRGGSAGGYTTLAALAFRDTFSAGASHYGIGDLEALAHDTHKFESRYLDSMIGRYPEDIEIYRARSPINHVDKLSSPAIFFQGLEDKVVPPNQAEAMVAALKAKGIPCAYVPFEGEQHGFRRSENIKRALELELYFYGRVFDFDPADEIDPIPIDNLPP